jgi:hypothetical protein
MSEKSTAHRTRTSILAPGRPSDKDNGLHAPVQLRLARTHGTQRKRRRYEIDLPVTGGRTSRTNSPKPPTICNVLSSTYDIPPLVLLHAAVRAERTQVQRRVALHVLQVDKGAALNKTRLVFCYTLAQFLIHWLLRLKLDRRRSDRD